MWAKKNAVGKEEVAKLVEDTYRFPIFLLLVSLGFDLYCNFSSLEVSSIDLNVHFVFV